MPTTIHCPACKRLLRVPEELLGQLVKCPTCQETFTAAEDARGSAAEEVQPPVALPQDEPVVVEETPGQPRRQRLRREDDEEDYEYRPKRRRRRWTAAREEAESIVAVPAFALIITGGLTLGLSLMSLVIYLILMAWTGDRRPAGGPDPALNTYYYVGSAVAGILWGGLVWTSAVKMKNLEWYRFALAGSIVAMLPFSCCFVISLPFGVWALVVLIKPEVRDAFD